MPGGTWPTPEGTRILLCFAYKRFDGVVPEPGELDDEDQALLERVEAGFGTVGELYNACKFRAAPSALLRVGLGEALALVGKPQLRRNCQADAPRPPWTARRPGSRSRRIRRRRRQACT